MEEIRLQFEEWLLPFAPETRELALAAREFIVGRFSDATEIVADSVQAVAWALTYTHTHVKGFVGVAAWTTGVSIVFTYGVQLDDPKKRLIGDGKQIRRWKLQSPADLSDPDLVELLDQAHSRAFRPDPPMPPKAVYMRYENAKKRRPAG